MTLSRAFFLIFTLILWPAIVTAGAGISDVSAEDPGLFLLMLAVLIGFIGCCLLAMLVLATIVIVCCCLVLAGVISVSAIAAWRHRSVSKGFKVFFYTVFALIGLTGGALAGLMAQLLILQNSSLTATIPGSALAGLLTGLFAAGTFLRLGEELLRRCAKSRT